MPIFEYTCKNCNENFELLVQSGTQAQCTSCGSRDLRKHFSVFAVNSSPSTEPPHCAGGCGDGFAKGSCGSGMCGVNRG